MYVWNPELRKFVAEGAQAAALAAADVAAAASKAASGSQACGLDGWVQLLALCCYVVTACVVTACAAVMWQQAWLRPSELPPP